MFSESDMTFYRNQWPCLLLEGWEETGARGYGLIWWRLPVSSRLNASACFFVGSIFARVSLEVRHPIHGFASEVIGDPTSVSAQQLQESIDEKLPGLVEKAIAEYEEWSAEIAAIDDK